MTNVKKEHMQIIDSAEDYENAIEIAAQPLLDDGYITKDYVQQMFDTIEKFGTYIVLADKFALPHARPSEAVKKTGLSLLVVKEAVDLKDNPVNLFIVLAAKDSSTHQDTLASLAEFLMEPKNIDDVINADSVDQIKTIIDERWN